MTTDPVWRAVADPTRRKLIELLRDGPKTTGELCRGFATSRFAVMKHLAVLERCGVVSVRRSGRVRWNALNPEPLRTIGAQVPAAADQRSQPVPAAFDQRSQQVPAAFDQRSQQVPAAFDQRSQQGFSPAPPPPPPPPPPSLSLLLTAPLSSVFDALTLNVAAWWGAPYLQSPDASNLVVEAQPGGRFYEEWGHRQGALRAVVSAVRQDERLELTGPIFGPAPCVLLFLLERREGGTLVTASITGGEGSVRDPRGAAGVLDDLVRVGLKAFVEDGTRTGLAS